MTKLELTKLLHDLRKLVQGKKFEEAEESFKDIESVKIRLKALDKE